MNSPAIFEVEAVPSKAASKGHGRRVVFKFYRDLGSVISGRRPKDADLELLESYRVLALPMKKHLEAVSVRFDGKTTEIPRNLDVRVDEILGPDQAEIGSVVGSLEFLDVHNQKNLFKIFPVVGPRSIKRLFDKRMLRDAIDGIDHFVKVSGQLHFKKTEKFPHLIKVTAIEVLPERSDAPKLSSLRGMATDAYGGMSSTDYIEKVRNGDW